MQANVYICNINECFHLCRTTYVEKFSFEVLCPLWTTITQNWVIYKQQKFIFHNFEDGEAQDLSYTRSRETLFIIKRTYCCFLV